MPSLQGRPKQIVIEGEVAVNGRWQVARTRGSIIFEDKSTGERTESVSGCWHCYLRQSVHGDATEKYVLSSDDVPKLPSDFVENASKGYITFRHITGRVTLHFWSNTRSKNLEDAVIILQCVRHSRSFEVQKTLTGFEIHDTFVKNASNVKSVGRNSKHLPSHRSVSDFCYWHYSRPVSGRDNYRHQAACKNGHNYRTNRYDITIVGCKRRQNSENRSSIRHQHYNSNNGGGRERSSRDNVTSRDNSERQQERCSRSQQPLKDRGSAENSLDRSDERREANHKSFRESPKNVVSKHSEKEAKSVATSRTNTSIDDWNEDDRLAHKSPVRSGFLDLSPKTPSVPVPNEPRFNGALGSQRRIIMNGTPERLPSSDTTDVNTRDSRPRISDSHSDTSPSNEDAHDSSQHLSRRRFYSTTPSPQLTIHQRTPSSQPSSQYISSTKRNGHHLSLSSAKKPKFNGSLRLEDKENVQNTDRSLDSYGRSLNSEIGFRNLGNTCYMNTALQAMFQINLFASDLLAVYAKVKESLMSTEDKLKVKCVEVRALCELLIKSKQRCGSTFQYKEDLEIALRRLLDAIKNCWNVTVTEMQDSHEFLMHIFTSTEEVFERLKFSPDVSNPIEKNFSIDVSKTITCMSCSTVVLETEKLYDIRVIVSKASKSNPDQPKSLQRLMQTFFNCKEFFNCERCQHNRCTVERRISRTPRMIVVHLLRYSVLQSGTYGKNDIPICVPQYVTLNNFVSSDCALNISNSETFIDSNGDQLQEIGTLPESSMGHTNGEGDQDWPEPLTSESEQVNKAISDSLLTAPDDTQLSDDIQMAKELSLKELEQQNSSSVTLDADEDGEEDPEDVDDCYKDNFESGYLPHSYRIATVIKHIGSVNGGHYTCLVANNQDDGFWKVYDDNDVRNISKDNALEDAGRHAYALIYIHKSLLKSTSV